MKKVLPVSYNDNPALSIIVPAFREVQNIPILAKEISVALESVIPEWELIIIDDNSLDGTVGVCDRIRSQGVPLNLVVRKNERGLATAVLEGFNRAKASVFVVMDADLSHNPKFIPLLYREIQEGAEFVLGSRYISGGGTDDRWTFYRYINSKLASLLARPLVSLSDPMSGFFALPRRLLERSEDLSPVGYKIGLEIIVKCKPKTLKEIPIHFRTRVYGESKLSIKQQLLYLYHLRSLYLYHLKAGKAL
jgi:dolichol-phosphate mannosyltransferase